MTYRQYIKCYCTRDNKLQLEELSGGHFWTRMESGVSAAESEVLLSSGLLSNMIQRHEMRPIIAAAAAYLEAAGYTLDTRLRLRTDWVSEDGRWRLHRHDGDPLYEGAGWLIRPHASDVIFGLLPRLGDSTIRPVHRTRDAAVEWAEATTAAYGVLPAGKKASPVNTTNE